MTHACPPLCERHDPEKPGWTWTWSGLRFWPLDPRPEDVRVEDVAHHLSLMCRFNGSTSVLYSVAEHCVRVSLACDPENAFVGLFHDSAEAYLADLARPVKRNGVIKAVWDPVEAAVHAVVCAAVGISAEVPDDVERADGVLAKTEMRDLFRVSRPIMNQIITESEKWTALNYEPLPERIYPWPADLAERLFLERYQDLKS